MTKPKRIINPDFINVATKRTMADGSRQQGLFYTKLCKFCQTQFEAQRQDAAFCSPRCQKAYKRKIKLEQQILKP